MLRRPPISIPTYTLFPYTPLLLSVDLFSNGHCIEYGACPFADDRFKQEQVRRRDNRTYSLALLIVLGLIHRDKHFKLKRAFVAVHVLDRDAAQLGFRRKDLVVGIDRHDVVELGHRPIGSEPALRSEEHTSELQSLMRISYAVF